MPTESDRFARQLAIVSQERLEWVQASVIGVGAIGRQVALQLASLGVRRLQLIDFDRIEPVNITCQGYLTSDIGQAKVTATAHAVRQIDPTVDVTTVDDRFRARYADPARRLALTKRDDSGPFDG